MAELLRGFKYRIYPKKSQVELLEQAFRANRFVWNYFLDLNIKGFEAKEGILSYNVMSKMLTALKKS